MMIIKEIAYREPVDLFQHLRHRPYSFFLDSGMDPNLLGRFSLLGSDPFLVFKSKGDRISVRENGIWSEKVGQPFDELQRLWQRYRMAPADGLPVVAGAFGYLAYDLGWHLEHLPDLARDDLGLPDCYLGFYDRLVVVDHQQKKAYMTSTGLPDTGSAARVRGAARMEQLEQLLSAEAVLVTDITDDYPACQGASRLHGQISHEAYLQAIREVKEYIAAGDIFQANFTQRFDCPLEMEPWVLYRRLREINPAPFAAYLSYPELIVASASPERYLQVRHGVVETRPIKGTRPRGHDAASDLRLRQELEISAKDHAELAMIIDLERNDLGRVCEFGSVTVPELFTLEAYATVFHLVSTVRGSLRPGCDLVDLLKATFPGGSITGAPKIRAMEIIETLEPVKRGIYTGSIGYLGFDGMADLNIVIRTIVIKGRQAYIQVGGGIVADSDPEAEYRETIDKGRALMQALGCGEEAVAS
jgi:para-aminobenzoate synthetase component 1